MTDVKLYLEKGVSITLTINLEPPLYVGEELDCTVKQITHEKEVEEWG